MPTPLTEDGSSWVEYIANVTRLTPEEFEELWALHPETRGTIRCFGREHTMQRWNAAYGRSYTFSGQVVPAADTSSEMPAVIQRCLRIANWGAEERKPGGLKYNMALVNWYQNGDDYISFHSDDERELVPGTPIACFSFGATRKFRLVPKKNSVVGGHKLNIELEDGSLVIMGGTCQRTHDHSIPKSKKVKDRRISITLRKFHE